MVAAANAGPKPIPYRLLSGNSLAEAIKYCLNEKIGYGAYQIALKMKVDDGVKSAVSSFHRHLPENDIRCDILLDQAATWSYEKSKRPMKLSTIASSILAKHSRLDVKFLKQ